MKPTLTDLTELCGVSPNLRSTTYARHITEARRLGFEFMPDALMQAIDRLNITVLPFDLATDFVIDDLVEYNGIVYKVLVDVTGEYPYDNANFEIAELETLYFVYVRPYWCYLTYKNVVLFSGVEIANLGALTPTPSYSQILDPDHRAAIMRNIEGSINTLKIGLTKYCSEKDWTFAAVVYVQSDDQVEASSKSVTFNIDVW